MMQTEQRDAVVIEESITVLLNRSEGWITVLTCKVGVTFVSPASVTVEAFTEEKVNHWLARKGEPYVSVFITSRVIGLDRP